MGEKEEKNIDWSLISKNLFGEANSIEKKEFENWLQASEKHREYVEQSREFYAFGEKERVEELNVEKAVQLFKDHILKTEKKTIRLSVWLRYAAAILIPVTIAIFLIFQTNNSEEELFVKGIKNFEPGSSKAELTLANGEIVNLEQRDTLVNEKDGTQISNTPGLLQYQGNQKLIENETYNTLKIPRGGEYQIVLADGTKVWLNSASSLTYPTKFLEKQRVVHLSGEAYFEVNHNAEKPFVVKVDDLNVKVLGTEFNVKAYPEEAEIQTTLVNGKVEVLAKGFDSHLKSVLSPSFQASYLKNQKELKVAQVKTEVYTAWKDGVFFLDNTKLEDFMIILSRWYDVKFFIGNELVKNNTYNGKMKKYDNLEDIFSLLEQLSDVEFVLEDDVVIVQEKI
jgi:ferric-dicitrate binding protein FerR (iron transport regulator)